MYKIIRVNFEDIIKNEKNEKFFSKEELITCLTQNLKILEFKKKGQTWFRDTQGITLVCNIQNSNYSKEDFYINVGVLVEVVEKGLPKSIVNTHFSDRIEIDDTIYNVYASIVQWFEQYDSFKKIVYAYRHNRLPSFTKGTLIDYLKKVLKL